MCILRKGVVWDATGLAQLPETENARKDEPLSVLTEKRVLADVLLISRAPEWDSGTTRHPAPPGSLQRTSVARQLCKVLPRQ